MITTIFLCPHCNSENIRKNGIDDCNGKQKYACLNCKSYGTLGAAPKYTSEQKQLIMNAYFERPSMRGIERIFNVSRYTLSSWLKKAAKLPENQTLETSITNVPSNDTLEFDEVHSYVKKNNYQWLWTVISRSTKKIVAFYIGDRSENSCLKLWELLPNRLKGGKTFSDFWKPYHTVIMSGCHQSVGKESGETNHMERWNNTLRQWLGRYTRKTLSFSKIDTMHELVTRLFIIKYNHSV